MLIINYIPYMKKIFESKVKQNIVIVNCHIENHDIAYITDDYFPYTLQLNNTKISPIDNGQNPYNFDGVMETDGFVSILEEEEFRELCSDPDLNDYDDTLSEIIILKDFIGTIEVGVRNTDDGTIISEFENDCFYNEVDDRLDNAYDLDVIFNINTDDDVETEFQKMVNFRGNLPVPVEDPDVVIRRKTMQMRNAVNNENYELAAQLRDEIKELTDE
jgi:hypothetical protein